MRTHRFAVAGLALVASTVLISCGSDNNSTRANSGVVAYTTLSGGSGSSGTIGSGTTLGLGSTLGSDSTGNSTSGAGSLSTDTTNP
ncbi:MAG TPA: hypothetical protein VGC84_15115 [Ilumatobacteraceae bacterium]